MSKFNQLIESILDNDQQQIPQDVINKIKEQELYVAKETGEDVKEIENLFKKVKTKEDLINALNHTGYDEEEAESFIKKMMRKKKK